MYKKLLAFALALALPVPALAGGVYTGKIIYIHIRASDGLIYLNIEGTPTLASCSATTNVHVAIKDETTNAGKQQLAALLAAHSTGRTVQILGANTCSRWSGYEDIDEVAVLNY